MPYRATIYRVDASCGIEGDIAPSPAKAIRAAEIKAGRLFILGLSCTISENRFGPDKSQFIDEATACAISAMRKRKARVERYSITDNSKNCTLEIIRV